MTQLVAHKRWEQAATEIAAYRRSHPDLAAGAVLQAEILIHMGLLADANDVLRHVLAVNPHSIQALSAFAELSRQLHSKETAEELLVRCTQYAPRDASTWKRLGDFYLSETRKEAIPAFQRALELAPRDASALAGVASARHQQGDDGGALSDFRQAVEWDEESNNTDGSVDFLYAEFLLDNTRYRDALQYYGQALRRDPSNTAARLGRAKALIHLQQWSAAEEDLKVTNQSEELKIESLNLLVKVYQAREELPKAQEAASEAERLSAEQNSEKALRNQIASALQNARSLMEQRKLHDAVAVYQSLLQDHPDVLSAWLGLARCLSELGNVTEGESAVRRAIGMQDNSAGAHALLGKLLLRGGQPAKARGEFARANDIDPLLMEARLGEAASYMVERKFPEAIRTLRFAKKMPGSGIEARMMLTEALYKSGEKELALKEIDQAIGQFGSSKEMLAMRESLLHKQP